MADQQISETEEEKTAWEGLLRRMLPAGAPLPDQEHLDYSISIDYVGPPLPWTSHTKTGGSSSSIATDLWRKSSSTVAPRNGRISSNFTSVRCENVAREIENFSEPVGSPIRDLGLRRGDADNSLDSDSNSMFSLKSLTIADDHFDLPMDSLKARTVAGDVISNLDSDSRFSLRSLFASTDQSGNAINNGDGEHSRGTAGRKAVHAPTVAVGENRNKKECTKCSKGTRLNFRETCIVFGARYCRNCMCS